MNQSSEEFSYQTNNKLSADNFPLIDLVYPLAMFYKRSVDNNLLYTLIQDKNIEFIVEKPSVEPYKTNSFQFSYVLSGQVTKVIEGKEYTFLAGQGCFLNPLIAQSDHIEEGHLLIIDISPPLLETIIKTLRPSFLSKPIFHYFNQYFKKEMDWQRNYIEFNSLLPIQNESFHKLLDQIQIELSTEPIGTEYFQKGLLLRLLDTLNNPHFFQLKNVSLDSNKEDFLVHRLKSLIEASHGYISRKEIEDTIHYNAEYLNRLLKKKTSHTISNYSKIIRIQKAQQLLTTTDLKITDIVEALNFSSENHFYHYFKKEVGMPPKQYRLKYQKSEN
ncbi:helix-turn-helix domain-containing protein [Streptococcus moroccensis]|uniref:AraC-like DNA-binding protein n=1 Tax=Streptococcus moroccensis TaxID=1451356 RepID=A0ABT9YS29_9STRE|nr:AraC family transcriptional regulator [Streptococcus moroccensis]MDQ0222123.1 AraC-like DNA-binding protein [Streptococcus moroccensis]